MFIESVEWKIPSTDHILGPNDHHIRKCGVIRHYSRLRVIFNIYTLHTGEGGIVRTAHLDLAPSSQLRCLGRSASRQSSLRKNRDCQQTATNFLLYQCRAYTEHQILFRVSQAPQTIYETPTARSCSAWYLARSLGASGIHQSRCSRRTRNCCCCPDPALAART